MSAADPAPASAAAAAVPDAHPVPAAAASAASAASSAAPAQAPAVLRKASNYSGSIPAAYDRHLRSMLFVDFADDLARRVAGSDPASRPQHVLEVAAGTGVVTAALRSALPGAEIVATDLNPHMLQIAQAAFAGDSKMQFQQADALALPFADASFDAVVCQFGVMFFPDRVGAYREMLRVLRVGGKVVLNTWDALERNEFMHTLDGVLAEMFTDPPMRFLSVPFGYHDAQTIERELRSAGFETVACQRVSQRSVASASMDVALGMVDGTPLGSEILQRDPQHDMQQVKQRIAEAIERRCATKDTKGVSGAMEAIVAVATKGK